MSTTYKGSRLAALTMACAALAACSQLPWGNANDRATGPSDSPFVNADEPVRDKYGGFRPPKATGEEAATSFEPAPELEPADNGGRFEIPPPERKKKSLFDLGGASPPPPSEDVWTIRCIELRGPTRDAAARTYVDALRHVKGLSPQSVYALNQGGATTVYYGRFERRYDARKKAESYDPDPMPVIKLIRSLSYLVPDASGGQRPLWPFLEATLDNLPSADAAGSARSDWNLSNVEGYYSLQVAVFYASEQMRQHRFAAEEYCRLLREQGREAYFHHGDAKSIVTVGTFPESAVQTVKQKDSLTGLTQFVTKIVDPDMLALQREFPYNLHDGHKFVEKRFDPATGQQVREPDHSFPVIIPGREKPADDLGLEG